MEYSNDFLIYVILGVVTWSVILYAIISYAVSGVSNRISNELREQNRFLMLLLKSHGVKHKDIYNAVIDSEEKFWKDLADSESGI